MDKDWIKFQIVPNLRSKNKSTIWLTWSVAVCDCPQSPSPAGSVVLPPVRASASTGRRSRSEKSWGRQLGQRTVRVTVTAVTAVLTYLRCRTPLCRPRLLPAGVAVLWPRPSSAQKCVITRKSLFSIHQWEIEMISIDIPPPVLTCGGERPPCSCSSLSGRWPAPSSSTGQTGAAPPHWADSQQVCTFCNILKLRNKKNLSRL